MKNDRVKRLSELGEKAGAEIIRQQDIFEEVYNSVIGGLEKKEPERAAALKAHRKDFLAINNAGIKGDFKKMDELTSKLHYEHKGKK